MQGLEQLISEYIVQILMVLIPIFIIVLGRKALGNLVSAIMFSIGGTFDTDDWIILDGEEARIKHIGLLKTSFWMVESGLIRYEDNENIRKLDIRKAPKPNPFILKEIYKWYGDLDKEGLDKMIKAYNKENGK